MSNVIPNQEITGMVRNCVAYCRKGTKVGDISLDAISDVLASDENGFVWLGLYEPDESLLLKLQEEFSLHPGTLLELRRAVRGFDLSALRARAPALLRARDRAGIERWLAQAIA